MDQRPGRGLWAAWGLALAGGISVVVAAAVVARASAACTPGFACDRAVPPIVTALALGGTAIAVVGGLIATVLALRRLQDGGRRSTG